jgi:hypothetical protein
MPTREFTFTASIGPEVIVTGGFAGGASRGDGLGGRPEVPGLARQEAQRLDRRRGADVRVGQRHRPALLHGQVALQIVEDLPDLVVRLHRRAADRDDLAAERGVGVRGGAGRQVADEEHDGHDDAEDDGVHPCGSVGGRLHEVYGDAGAEGDGGRQRQ